MTGDEALATASTGTAATRGMPPRDFRPLGADLAELDLFRAVLRTAERSPAALAIVGAERSVSYGEFMRRALSIAACVRDARAADGVVALAVGMHSFPTAAFGVLAAGAAFVPLDVSWPNAMISGAIAACGARIVLHDAAHAERLAPMVADGSLRARTIALDSIDLPGAPVRTIDGRARAAVFFTSGSTGRPKGVAMGHRFLLEDAIRQSNDAMLSPSDRADLLYPPSFSAILMPLIGIPLAGASMHPFDAREWLHRLPAWLVEQAITVSRQSTAMLRFICAGGPRPAPALRLLSVTGETLRAADVEAFRRTFAPSVVLRHGYGSSEARTIAQSFFLAGDEVEDPVPLGTGVPDREISIVDPDGNALPTGTEGEVAVTALRLADGYLGDAAGRTRFEPLPDGRIRLRTGDRGRLDAAGRLCLLGRLDDMVKVRGQRVEVLVVERAFAAVAGVEDAVVIPFLRKDGATGLAAFVAARKLGAAAVRAALVRVLEPAAIPERIEVLPELPKTSSSKVDRRRLLADRSLVAPSEASRSSS